MSDQHRILLVDDDPLFRKTTQLVLESEGYNVTCADSADEALNLAREQRPDLVLLDVMMDGLLDGVYVTEVMLDDAELSQIPIIMVSAIASTPHVGLFPTDRYLHAVDFLFKPVEPAELLESVDRFITRGRRQGSPVS
jgi:CheY-like chemotaxis protein